MKKFLNGNSWWFYFVLTFIISWPVWAFGKAFLPENLTIITTIIGAFGPLISAIILLRANTGRVGFKEWLKTNFNFRVNCIPVVCDYIVGITKGTSGYRKKNSN
jgi:hypothetical protein